MSSPAIDYNALAAQHGAISSEPDYNALAKQHGAVSSEPSNGTDKRGFWESLGDKLNPMPAIREWMNRPEEVGKSMEALHVLNQIHAEAAKDPANKGKPVNEWKSREPTADEQAVIDRGMNAGLPGGEGNALTETTDPAVEAGRQAAGGNLKGAAGTLAGGYVVPLAIAHIASKMGSIPIAPKIASKLTPEAESAVDFADQHDIPISAGTRTGDKFVKNVQAIAQNQPIASGIATRAQAATRAALTRTGEQIADEVNPAPMSPEDAGGHVQQELGQLSKIQQQGATKAYGRLEKIEADPQHARQVQVGTRRVEGSADQSINGTPAHDEPIMKSVALPVDMGPAIEQLRPVLDQIKQQMPIAQQQASRGLQAVDNIVNGDRIQPASMADQNLSALKSLQRENLNPKTMRLANTAVDAVAPLVDQAVAKAGPAATDALNEGRMLTKAKYATDATIDQLPVEPVKLFDKLTAGRDTNINLLRDVASQAPTSMPAMGRATLEGLLEKATSAEGKPGAGTAYSNWGKLGDSTKQILFPDPVLRGRLDNFFTLAKSAAENPNPSGTAHLGSSLITLTEGGVMLHNPVLGTAMLLAWPAVTKMLYSEGGAKLLMNGLRVPISNKVMGGILAGSIMREAAPGTKSPSQELSNPQPLGREPINIGDLMN